ncbi:MAG: universal stress protein [Calditrichia bacterium]|nr:universal stress protein [Calditrichota bacterium]MCB0269554.1 universal stress protein [Calditrichota bacterium]MCB0288100.1 universal stress protein [Calditrichota bacterium]MCB9066519.1 universal stress protein [Calditrichia bacterium]
MFKPEKILVPTDFSEDGIESSKIAVKQAIKIAEGSGSELIFLHVITDDITRKPLFFLDDDKFDELKKDMHTNAKKELKRFAEKYIDGRSIRYSLKVRAGAAYDEILKEEKESGIDLISIASRGMSALHDFFYGSTTEKVVRRATCNVLVVRKFSE